MEAINLCKTRFAPSPTGLLHIGGARTALFNWLWAKHCKGRFILRFEDTDQSRSSEEYKSKIIEDLHWLGLKNDGEIVSQSERLERYSEVKQKLIELGEIYPCFCPQEELACHCGEIHRGEQLQRAETESHCWRIRAPKNEKTVFTDLLRGEIVIDNDNFGDFVLIRSDGWPTYLLTVVVDDHDTGITEVIRGEEHLSNVPKQLLIYKALGWTPPKWAHIPMVLDSDRQKLSKRTGAMSIGEYRELGWQPQALTAYMATLSWSHAPTDTIVSLDELAEKFLLQTVALASPVHDESRLHYFGRLAMNSTAQQEALEQKVKNSFPQALQEDVATLARELVADVCTTNEFSARLNSIKEECFVPVFEGAPPCWYQEIIEQLQRVAPEEWASEKIKAVLKSVSKQHGLKGIQLYHPLRLALTGKERGIPLPLFCSLLGKEKSLYRLARILSGGCQ